LFVLLECGLLVNDFNNLDEVAFAVKGDKPSIGTDHKAPSELVTPILSEEFECVWVPDLDDGVLDFVYAFEVFHDFALAYFFFYQGDI
jgi:hypothetical protein